MNYFREMHKVKLFIEKLADYHHPDVFNPWADYDPDYDVASARDVYKRQVQSEDLSDFKLKYIYYLTDQ